MIISNNSHKKGVFMSNPKGAHSNAKDCDYKSKNNASTQSSHTENTSNNVQNQKRITTSKQEDTERRDGPGGN
jgi:hypothetical protein